MSKYLTSTFSKDSSDLEVVSPLVSPTYLKKNSTCKMLSVRDHFPIKIVFGMYWGILRQQHLLLWNLRSTVQEYRVSIGYGCKAYDHTLQRRFGRFPHVCLGVLSWKIYGQTVGYSYLTFEVLHSIQLGSLKLEVSKLGNLSLNLPQ